MGSQLELRIEFPNHMIDRDFLGLVRSNEILVFRCSSAIKFCFQGFMNKYAPYRPWFKIDDFQNGCLSTECE